MTIWDTERRRAFIKECVAEKLQADGASNRIEVIDQITSELLEAEHDLEQLIRAEVITAYDGAVRRRDKDGIRAGEVSYDADGLRIDRPTEQMTIPGMEDAARRKIKHGDASVAEGQADLAVAAEARRRCRLAGADPEAALIGQWLTREEIVAIRRGDEGTSLRAAA